MYLQSLTEISKLLYNFLQSVYNGSNYSGCSNNTRRPKLIDIVGNQFIELIVRSLNP